MNLMGTTQGVGEMLSLGASTATQAGDDTGAILWWPSVVVLEKVLGLTLAIGIPVLVVAALVINRKRRK